MKKLYRRLFIYSDEYEPRPGYLICKKKKDFKRRKLEDDCLIWLGPIEEFYYKENNIICNKNVKAK